MKLVRGAIYPLRIPFVETFRHAARDRSWCDSVVVEVEDDTGVKGFGEGAPRPYVTGETVDGAVAHLAGELWPRVAERAMPWPGPAFLAEIDALIPSPPLPDGVAWHASRAALELAIVDCALRRAGRSAGDLLPPRRRRVVYSGVITAGSIDDAVGHARRLRMAGLAHVKVKVGFDDDVARVGRLREVLGGEVSLRLDANGAWDLDRAVAVLRAVEPLGIAAVEQPLPRGPVEDLARLRRACRIPIMVDESLVTLADAAALIAAGAADLFNVRVSKCGGLFRSAAVAARAAAAGLGVQVGSQVGETGILAAAGRHLAASLLELAFAEGSFGSLLLVEDVCVDSVRFGHGGVAPVLTGPGLGVDVAEERLRRYASAVIPLGPSGGLP